jgi:hypothetical protein
MTGWLRRAGHGRAPDGSIVTWSVAEGRRGRRWREVVRVGDAIRSSLLLELDPERRFSHLELSTAAGLLTLHPEPDRTLHGNAVTGNGIRHIAGWPWSPDRAIALTGSTVCLAAARRRDGAGATEWLAIGLDLALDPVVRLVRRDSSLVDADGLPVLADGASWPLEEEA